MTAPLVWKAIQKDLQQLGGSAMMTEGLACNPPFNNSNECTAVMGDLDANLLSWTDYGDSQGAQWLPSTGQQEEWARTYARAVQGSPLNMTFDPTTKAFAFCFHLDPTIEAPTEVFASKHYSYPNGRSVTLSSNLVLESTPTGLSDDIVLVKAAVGAQAGDTACLGIAAS